MFLAVVIFHVIIAVSLILVVLMQSSKGEALAGSAFGGGGGGGGGGSFGGARVPFLSKVTTVLAMVFMINCVGLTMLSAQKPALPGGQLDPNAKSIVTEKMQKEIQANQAAAGTQFDTSVTEDGGLNLDSLIDVVPAADAPASEDSAQ